ncbi:MAG: 3-dehydroquinate synthase [Oscillospiraceae bacterium]|nr:3-dehydroquinate synthase [Oscillospiraceae bacterium]
MKIIKVSASKSYDVFIGTNILDRAGDVLRRACGGQTAAVITDGNVDALYAPRLEESLMKSGYRTVKYVFAHGEASKTPGELLSILDFLAEKGLGRADTVAALGGGVAGDLAGFAAACYMRGIHFAQFPTTLLAAVDSSVGGKTGVNLSAGKNLAGAFYQPDAVLCDVSLFATLPADIFRDGCAEVIKCAVIADHGLFYSLEDPIQPRLEEITARCVEIKSGIVARDERETGTRKLLNFGHTVGHAIEFLSGYKMPHGHAVAAGMAIETRMAVNLGICGEECLRGILAMLRRYGLPESTSRSADEIACACLRDKKRIGDAITMAFPEEIGKCALLDIPIGELEPLLGRSLS